MPIPRHVLILLLVTATAIHAEQAAENCERELSYEDLVGTYTITFGNAVLEGGGRTVPMKKQDVAEGSLALVDEALVLAVPDAEVTFRFAGSEEPAWRWSTDLEMAAVDSEDLGVALGCDVNRLPRLVGSGESRSAEGRQLDLTYRLVVPVDGLLYGQFQWHGDGMTMTRPITFQRRD